MDGTPPTTPDAGPAATPRERRALGAIRRARWPTWVAVLLCLAATGFLTWKSNASERRLLAARLEAPRQGVRDWAQKRLDMVRWALVAARGLFDSSDLVERAEWRTYIASILHAQDMEWVTGMFWVEAVDRAALEGFVRAQREERARGAGRVAGFGAWPDLEEPPPRPSVVVYAEPEEENAAALGFLASTDREMRQAMRHAADSGDAAMTGAMRLPWAPAAGTDAVVFLRVEGGATSARERPSSQRGWVAATVSLERLFSGAYGSARPSPEIDVQVLQEEPEGGGRPAVIVPWATARFGGGREPEPASALLRFGGWTWRIQFRYPPGYEPREDPGEKPVLVLALGLALTLLVAAVLGNVARTGRRAEELAGRMTAALKGSEAALRTTIEAVPDGLVVVNDAGRVLSFNPAAERLFGWPSAEIAGEDVRLLFGEQSVHVGDSIFGWRERPLGEGAPAEITARRRDGRLFTAEVHARDTSVGGRRQVTALFRDITERRQAEEERRRHQEEVEAQKAVSDEQARRLSVQAHELEVARDQADASARAKGEFLAAVSHEIRTPLNGILGMAHLLLESHLGGEQEECAQTIRTSAEALLAILNDILDVSKIEAGRILLESVPFDLRAACEDVLDLLAPEVRLKRIDLVLRFAPGTPRHFVGDAGRVRQVLLNLVHNAVKFTERGHVLVDVHALETGAKDTVIEVRVEDTGIGIAQEKIAALFRRFAQADSSTTRRYGGTGLGLLICRLLVERMGGTVAVESVPGTGSTFRFTMRLPRDPGAPAEPAPDAGVAGRRVLLSAEGEVLRRVMREEAESLGLAVEEAAGWSPALAALRAAAARGEGCAVALLLAGAEDAEAADFVREVRADPALRATPLALVVDAPRQGGARAAEEAGFDAYLVRPVRHEDLRDATSALVRRAEGGRGSILTRQTLAAARRGEAARRTAGGEAGTRARRRVLLAEDNAVNQKVAARMLERLNCVVDVAANGREAVEMVDRFPYDLVFMDCQMPEMDGYEAAREIRRREAAGRRVPILALTAHALDEDRQRCIDAGMDDYVRKPVSPDDLDRMLTRWA